MPFSCLLRTGEIFGALIKKLICHLFNLNHRSLHTFEPCHHHQNIICIDFLQTQSPTLSLSSPYPWTPTLVLIVGDGALEVASVQKIVSPMTRLQRTRGTDSLLTTKPLYFQPSIRVCVSPATVITATEFIA